MGSGGLFPLKVSHTVVFRQWQGLEPSQRLLHHMFGAQSGKIQTAGIARDPWASLALLIVCSLLLLYEYYVV